MFARVEEESERRAQRAAEEAALESLFLQAEAQDDVPNPIATVSSVRQRRRGSVSVSRFGEVSLSALISIPFLYLSASLLPRLCLILSQPWFYVFVVFPFRLSFSTPASRTLVFPGMLGGRVRMCTCAVRGQTSREDMSNCQRCHLSLHPVTSTAARRVASFVPSLLPNSPGLVGWGTNRSLVANAS